MIQGQIEQIRDELAAQRQKAITRYQKRPQPDLLLKDLSRICDHALRRLAEHCPLPTGAALAAVGGYGRQEMYPYSDVDVLLLLDGDPSQDDVRNIERFVAGMWDLGLAPGHSVRSVSQCVAFARDDVTIETALLEARWITGKKTLVEHLLSAMGAQLNAAAFFQAKRAEMQRRHTHYHETPYALEPNCKESPGALRDLQLLLWLAQAAGYGATWTEVARHGALTASEHRSLRRAGRAFRRLRVELHLLTKRREDRVLFDLQPALAQVYGFCANSTHSASELLMQRYYWAARVVTQLTTILMPSIEERLFPPLGAPLRLDDDFCARDSRLDIKHDDAFERNPALIFKAFLCVQENTAVTGMSAGTLRAIWHARHRIDNQFRQNPVNHDLFLRILKQPNGVADALYSMTTLNVLPRYLPAFRRIVGQMQHDLFHAYTVDEHTLKVVRNLRRFSMAEYAHEYPQASQLMADFDAPWLVYIAAMFHDIAKGRGGNHSELGAQDALKFCQQHHLAPADTDLVVFLVLEHLLMSTVAQKRDLSDPRVIHHFATTVKSKRQLDALYLLTIADIRATNPTTWNSWKGKLLEDLYQRTLIALGGTLPDSKAVLAQRMQEATTEVTALGISKQQRTSLWAELDVAYFMRHDANEIAWHTEQLAARLEDSNPLVRARVLGHNEALQVMVWAPDRHDLFVTICEYFDRRTLSIQDARIHTSKHGWALDSFVVLVQDHEAVYQELIGDVQRELASQLDPVRSPTVSACPTGQRRAASSMRRARAFPIRAHVDIRADADNTLWRVSIVCMDRPGLLLTLAHVFNAHQTSLKMAKIHTLGDRAEDVFILDGEQLAQPKIRLQFERAIMAALNSNQTA